VSHVSPFALIRDRVGAGRNRLGQVLRWFLAVATIVLKSPAAAFREALTTVQRGAEAEEVEEEEERPRAREAR
jgi:hypothetical protein